jgi:hypothetical protein
MRKVKQMAKVVVTYDTDTKELNMTIDGEDKGSLERFCTYSEGSGENAYGYFEADFKGSKENGVRYRMSAHGSKIVENDVLEQYAREVFNKKLK